MSYWENANHSWTQDSLRYINTPVQKTRELFYYIQEIGHFKAFQPYFTERANLPSYLMKFTLSGEGTLAYANKEYILRRGDVFFIDCQQYQHYATTSQEPWEMDWVHFYGGNTAAFYNEFIKNGTHSFHTSSQHCESNPIHVITQKLLTLQAQQTAKTAFHSSLLLHELLNELLLQKYQLDFAEEEIPDYVLAMQEFIESHFKEKLTLEQLEQQFHINRYQLSKEFSRYIGLPPIDYQIAKKISYAKDLLRYSALPIKEIAVDIGLENVAYFSRLFKKRTGLSPTTYRKIG